MTTVAVIDGKHAGCMPLRPGTSHATATGTVRKRMQGNAGTPKKAGVILDAGCRAFYMLPESKWRFAAIPGRTRPGRG